MKTYEQLADDMSALNQNGNDHREDLRDLVASYGFYSTGMSNKWMEEFDHLTLSIKLLIATNDICGGYIIDKELTAGHATWYVTIRGTIITEMQEAFKIVFDQIKNRL